MKSHNEGNDKIEMGAHSGAMKGEMKIQNVGKKMGAHNWGNNKIEMKAKNGAMKNRNVLL